MKKILVLGALSLFGLSEDACEAMASRTPLLKPAQVEIYKDNLANLDALLTGKPSSIRIKSWFGRTVSDVTTVLEKLDNETVKGIEELWIEDMYNDEQAEHLINIIKRNSESLKKFFGRWSLEKSRVGVTKLQCINIVDVLSKCPHLYSVSLYTAFDEEVLNLRRLLVNLTLCQERVAREIGEMARKQEELETLISKARAQNQGDQLVDQQKVPTIDGN